MKFTTSFSAVLACLLLLTPLYAHDILAETEPEKERNVRFKIFTAEHEAVSRSGGVVKVKSIFKMDLQTGTVWRYRQGVDKKGNTYEEFFEVPNQ